MKTTNCISIESTRFHYICIVFCLLAGALGAQQTNLTNTNLVFVKSISPGLKVEVFKVCLPVPPFSPDDRTVTNRGQVLRISKAPIAAVNRYDFSMVTTNGSCPVWTRTHKIGAGSPAWQHEFKVLDAQLAGPRLALLFDEDGFNYFYDAPLDQSAGVAHSEPEIFYRGFRELKSDLISAHLETSTNKVSSFETQSRDGLRLLWTKQDGRWLSNAVPSSVPK